MSTQSALKYSFAIHSFIQFNYVQHFLHQTPLTHTLLAQPSWDIWVQCFTLGQFTTSKPVRGLNHRPSGKSKGWKPQRSLFNNVFFVSLNLKAHVFSHDNLEVPKMWWCKWVTLYLCYEEENFLSTTNGLLHIRKSLTCNSALNLQLASVSYKYCGSALNQAILPTPPAKPYRNVAIIFT